MSRFWGCLRRDRRGNGRSLSFGDRGRIAVFYAALAPAFLVMLGLVIDGGGKVRALQRADNIAMEAARAAGQEIRGAQAVQGGAKEVDRGAAAAAAQAYWVAAGADGGEVIFGTNDAGQDVYVYVTVWLNYDTKVLSFIGITGWTNLRGRATGTLVSQ